MTLTTAIEISSPPEEVFARIDDPDQAMRWQKNVKGGKIIKETAERTGTTFTEVMEENGKTLEMRGEIKEYIPDQCISFQLESKIHSVFVKYSVTGNTDKSTLTAESVIRWKFPMNLICLVIGRKIKANIERQTNAEFSELKRLCEAERSGRR